MCGSELCQVLWRHQFGLCDQLRDPLRNYEENVCIKLVIAIAPPRIRMHALCFATVPQRNHCTSPRGTYRYTCIFTYIICRSTCLYFDWKHALFIAFKNMANGFACFTRARTLHCDEYNGINIVRLWCVFSAFQVCKTIVVDEIMPMPVVDVDRTLISGE